MADPQTFEVYHRGEVAVIGFAGKDAASLSVEQCRDEIGALLNESEARTLAVDVTGVKVLASGLLGLLAAVARRDVRVLVFNPERDVADVLEITRLNTVLSVRTVDIPAAKA